MKTVFKTIISIILIFLILNVIAFAMNNTIYSYTVEDEGLNLIMATVPKDTETLEIIGDIGGVPVISLDDNFIIRQFTTYGDTAFLMTTDLMSEPQNGFSVRSIIVPDSVQRVSGNMVRDFNMEQSIVDLKIPRNAVITETTVPNIYIHAPNLYGFYRTYGNADSETTADMPEKLSEVGTPIDLYVDGEYIDGCILYNGITYAPYGKLANNHHPITGVYGKEGPVYSIWYGSMGAGIIGPQLMVIECKLKTPEKFLDENSAYTDEENAKYEMTARQIMFNANTCTVTTTEIYKPVDETELAPAYTYDIIGVSGGEVKIETMPVYSGYIPVRMICEAAQRKVEWDSETNAVYVTTPEE